MTLIPQSKFISFSCCHCPVIALLKCNGHSSKSLMGNNNINCSEVIITECYTAHRLAPVGVVIFFLIMLERFRTNF